MSSSATLPTDHRFAYLLDRIRDEPITPEPFPHLYLEDFLEVDDLAEILAAPSITLPGAADVHELFDHLTAAGFERIDFPGCVQSLSAYTAWLEEKTDPEGTNPNCEAQGLAFRLTDRVDEAVRALDAFFRTPELQRLLTERFDIGEPVAMEGGVQKYLHGYEISPHPDIRKKALTWMLNLNPAPDAAEMEMHTHFMRFRPEWQYVSEIWRANPTVETCWVPWDWADTVRQQTENNSIVFFAPRHDTLHAVRANYDHLPAQRTQLYGNLWYENPVTPSAKPDHEDLSFLPDEARRGAETTIVRLRAERDAAVAAAAEAQRQLDAIRSQPMVRLARGVRSRLRRGGGSSAAG